MDDRGSECTNKFTQITLAYKQPIWLMRVPGERMCCLDSPPIPTKQHVYGRNAHFTGAVRPRWGPMKVTPPSQGNVPPQHNPTEAAA